MALMKHRMLVLSVMFIFGWMADRTESAAQIKVIPESALDSLANPRLSDDWEKMDFPERIMDGGTIRESDVPVYEFTFTNKGDSTLTIGRITTNCSCVEAKAVPQTVVSGGKGVIRVTYHAAGHPGTFERKIWVYTGLSGKAPTAYLRLKIHVTAEEYEEFPVVMGKIRLRKKLVEFSKKVRQTAELEYVNISNTDFRPACHSGFLPPYIRFEADRTAPGEKGMIRLTFNPDMVPAGRELAEIQVLMDGTGLSPRNSVIYVNFK